MVCGDPESGTDHSLKEVSAYIRWYRVHTWGLQGKFQKLRSCELLCKFTNDIHVSVKNSSTEGTCLSLKGTCSIVVIWVILFQTELMVEIYFKILVRANGEVLLMKFS